MWYLPLIENRLTEEQKNRLKSIYYPTVVGTQPEDSRRGFCVTKDGEIRHYGRRGKTGAFDEESGTVCYVASRDGGMTWEPHDAPHGALGAAFYDETRGRYVTVFNRQSGEDRGTFAYLSEDGYDDTAYRRVKIADEIYYDMFQPKCLASGRYIVTMQKNFEGRHVLAVALSDDGGEHWRIHDFPDTISFEIEYPNIDPRWENNYSESVVTEVSPGHLYLLVRTSRDCFYEFTSDDNGDTWSEGRPSPFYGTLTTPFFLTLSDGRTILFWNNTYPLPEPCHANELPPHAEGFTYGGENAFTNRDVSHAAVTDDFKNWTGLRELYLNPVRNRSDFRTYGGMVSSADKSVHQFQAIELPFGKVLVAVGQHEAVRKLIIFDPAHLCETSRKEDFQNGLVNLTTHLYVKSLSGSYVGKGLNGHCHWNRTDGALLLPDPSMNGREVLQIGRTHDERLVNEKQGAVWNFPNAKKGCVTVELQIEGAGIAVCLCDRWFNACDDTAWDKAVFAFRVTPDLVVPHRAVTLTVAYDVDAGRAEVFTDGKKRFFVRLKNPPPFGVSYLHLMTLAETSDFSGTLIRSLAFEAR